MKFTKIILAFVAMLSTDLFAHSGHDHGNPVMAFIEHLVWMAPAVIAVAAAFYWFENRKQSNKD